VSAPVAERLKRDRSPEPAFDVAPSEEILEVFDFDLDVEDGRPLRSLI
jgi:hypothetical protein